MTRTRPPGTLNRRHFLAAASAALLPAPALAQSGGGVTNVDVVIIGGGAAGIAAARRIADAKRSYVLLEASEKLGGRARTDTVFGVRVDLGAGGFARSEGTLAASAQAAGQSLISLPSGRRLFADGHEVRESAYDAFTLALGTARRDLRAMADSGKDVAATLALQAAVPDPATSRLTAPWAATVAQFLGPLSCGRALATLSSLDLSRRDAPPDDTTSPSGIGTLMEGLGAWLNVQKQAPVTLITHGGRFHAVAVRGQRAPIRARAIVLAVPAPVLAAGAIRFNPGLPPRLVAALRAVPAGALEQVAFLLPGNPLALEPNEAVLARAGTAPPALLRGRIGGSDLHMLTFGDAPARTIAEKGEPAALALARDWLRATFPGREGAIGEVACSRWGQDPLIRGALSAALPGQGAQRRIFADTVQNRIFLAGDYVPASGWGTLGGAWASGEAAATRALRLFGDGPA
ncbi:FAD-dependent oxidoreductase [Ancylobacter dichloromethanicus]|uniref:Tryptophan 2-monooxygenase n=1 Tax=Ancylobacter dichloromethanicus TaxID=518825 RepID=A0A9W6JA75_9HYPH|nr:FAD-dependent oxidoreductase [Ancylobacter dichloromethanicus]MBS7556696.1 FAD-dependent oxidoreductase [Ancylobacter dichloromethanicus]GLK73547.1 amine oxidase [Ancylobacter dichloromethanicus]